MDETLGNISRPSLSAAIHYRLITDPKVAFTGDTHQAKGNNDWMITVSEFKNHRTNYIKRALHHRYQST